MCIKIVFSCDFNRYRAQRLRTIYHGVFCSVERNENVNGCITKEHEKRRRPYKNYPKAEQIMPVMIDEYLVVEMFQRFTECIVSCLSSLTFRDEQMLMKHRSHLLKNRIQLCVKE